MPRALATNRIPAVLRAPTDLPNCCLDLDASRLVGLVDSDPVSSFTDQSGTGAHATAAGAARPLYKTGIQNGLPGVLYDGATSQSDLVAATLGITGDATIFVAGRTVGLGGAANNGGLFGNGTGAGGRIQVTHLQTDSLLYAHWNLAAGGVSTKSQATKAAGAAFIFESARDMSAPVRCSLDGAFGGVPRSGRQLLAHVGTTVGNAYSIGRDQALHWWNGYIHHIVAYRRRLFDVERKKVLEMLNAKWQVV